MDNCWSGYGMVDDFCKFFRQDHSRQTLAFGYEYSTTARPDGCLRVIRRLADHEEHLPCFDGPCNSRSDSKYILIISQEHDMRGYFVIETF